MEGGIGNAEEGIFRFGIVDCGMLNQPPARGAYAPDGRRNKKRRGSRAHRAWRIA
jgi:hypothetical protein